MKLAHPRDPDAHWFDEVAVHLAIDKPAKYPPGRMLEWSELCTVVDHLAARRLTDWQIGQHIGLTGVQMRKFRDRRAETPAPVCDELMAS